MVKFKKKVTKAVGSFFLIVFLIGWCSGDNKKDNISTSSESSATATNFTAPVSKPVERPPEAPANDQDWQQMVKQANQAAAQKGMIGRKVKTETAPTPPPPRDAPPIVVVSPSNDYYGYNSGYSGSGGGCNGREINVRGYYRKDGTYVSPHTRCR